MTDTFPFEELRQLLEKARTADAELKQFGAKDHKYQWNPPAALSDVEEFERELGVTLPEGYRDFLLQAGDGGAGPFYGLFSLKQVRGWLGWPLEPEKPPVLRPGMSKVERDEEKNWKRGCIPIESQGDTYFTCLMVSGPDRGRVVYIDYEGSWVFFPREPDFLSWYTRWLRDTGNGYQRIGGFATDLAGDEESLHRHYQCAESKEEQWLAIISMEKFPALSSKSVELIRTAMADRLTMPDARGVLELLHRTGIDQWFLEWRWEAGLYPQVVREVYRLAFQMDLPPKPIINRWWRRVYQQLFQLPQEVWHSALGILAESGEVSLREVSGLLEYAERPVRDDLPRDFRQFPDAEEHIDIWVKLLQEPPTSGTLNSTLIVLPLVRDERLLHALQALVEEYPSEAAVSVLAEIEHEFLNPKWPWIPRPYWLQLDFWQRADLGIDRTPPPDGIALHPFIALGMEEAFHHIPSTAYDWNRDLERIKTLKLIPSEKNIRVWNAVIFISDRMKSKETGSRKVIIDSPCKEFPPDPFYFDLHDWSAINRMPNLTALMIEEVCVDDFSFLAGCQNVRKLSLRNTNFTDCRLLRELTNLQSVDLRLCHLTHTEALEKLQGVQIEL
ncbi:hypothetical protein D1646_17180 [Pseudoflavonifractor sp. 60]|uniref:SMI1/KNR4 family protein n=1 Tax=Pseudoflavonifractor sp. 60 TaxID=2304576 RepID=UPI00136A100A|nr:SMI1/KNR4 family protein [Pseudoflavonifractor sp. 60]NBI68488.1 hypothetical protein [Pseudoflavonifractor sp. 60]